MKNNCYPNCIKAMFNGAIAEQKRKSLISNNGITPIIDITKDEVLIVDVDGFQQKDVDNNLILAGEAASNYTKSVLSRYIPESILNSITDVDFYTIENRNISGKKVKVFKPSIPSVIEDYIQDEINSQTRFNKEIIGLSDAGMLDYIDNLIDDMRKEGLVNRYSVKGAQRIWIPGGNFGEDYDIKRKNIEENFEKIKDFLNSRGVPSRFVQKIDTERKTGSYIEIDAQSLLNYYNSLSNVGPEGDNNTTIISEMFTKDQENVKQILDFLSNKCGISYEIITKKKAKELLGKTDKEVSTINAFVNGNTVYFIKGGQLNANIAAEEMLHPFVTAIKNQNPEAFDRLLSDARSLYEKLNVEVQLLYNEGENRDEELVTKALSRAFNEDRKDYPEGHPITDIIHNFIKSIQRFFNPYSWNKTFPDEINASNLDQKSMSIKNLAEIVNSDLKLEGWYTRRETRYNKSNTLGALKRGNRKSAFDLQLEDSEKHIKRDKSHRYYYQYGGEDRIYQINNSVTEIVHGGNNNKVNQNNVSIIYGNEIDDIVRSIFDSSKSVGPWLSDSPTMKTGNLGKEDTFSVDENEVKIKDQSETQYAANNPLGEDFRWNNHIPGFSGQKLDAYQEQLTYYAKLCEVNGVTISSINILPIKLNYNDPTYTLINGNYVPNIEKLTKDNIVVLPIMRKLSYSSGISVESFSPNYTIETELPHDNSEDLNEAFHTYTQYLSNLLNLIKKDYRHYKKTHNLSDDGYLQKVKNYENRIKDIEFDIKRANKDNWLELLNFTIKSLNDLLDKDITNETFTESFVDERIDMLYKLTFFSDLDDGSFREQLGAISQLKNKLMSKRIDFVLETATKEIPILVKLKKSDNEEDKQKLEDILSMIENEIRYGGKSGLLSSTRK